MRDDADDAQIPREAGRRAFPTMGIECTRPTPTIGISTDLVPCLVPLVAPYPNQHAGLKA